MKEILFVNPPILKSELYGELGSAGSAAYPLGLCSLAAVVRERNFQTVVLDACALKMDLEDTVEEILSINPRYLGLTAVTITIDRVNEIAKKVKRRKKDIVIILGGPHITAVPEETLSCCPSFDIGVIGEGELTVVELLTTLEKGGDLTNVSGLILRKNGTITRTAQRPFIDDLDTLPFPAWDLLPHLPQYYHPTVYSFNKLPSTHLVTSRGCPGKCIFCDTAVFGKKYRFFSSGYVMKMIRHLYSVYGIRDILFDDDLFIGHKKRLIEICNMLIAEKLDLSWSCNARVDLIDRDMLQLMKKSGCWQIAYGIESGSQKILDYIKKNTTLEQTENVLRWTTQTGIRTKGFFMMAYPIETKLDVLQTIEFAKKIDLYDFQINFFTPLPGSQAYSIAKELGIKVKDWHELNLHTEPTFIPEGMTKEELIRLNKIAFKKFYLRPKIIFSYLKLVRNWNNLLKLLNGSQALIKFWISVSSKQDEGNTNYKKYESRNPLVKIFVNRFMKQLSLLISGCPAELILDLGCGESYIISYLIKRSQNSRIVGVDLSFDTLMKAKERNPACLFVQADIMNLPFKDNSFPTVICLETLEHIEDGPRKALAEIKRVASDRIIVSVPNEPFFRLSNLFMLRRMKYLGSDPEHKHAWTRGSFLRTVGIFLDIVDYRLPFPWVMVLARKVNKNKLR